MNRWGPIGIMVLWITACTPALPTGSFSLSKLFSAISPSKAQTVPADTREISFPTDMTAWGYYDVTKNGSIIGCPDALPNQSDQASATQTTNAIQCRINQMGIYSETWSSDGIVSPQGLYFPAGNYYINQTIGITYASWNVQPNGIATITAASYPDGSPVQRTVGFPHVLGYDPTTTKIIWTGSCGMDPNVIPNAWGSNATKHTDMFYISGVDDILMERLTLDGQNCAGNGVDMYWNGTRDKFNEMIIQNFTEIGIVGDRPALTTYELGAISSDNGANSEVSITNVRLLNIGYAGIATNTANALDYWIRDTLFSNCGIGITTDIFTFPTGAVAGMNWGTQGGGNFNVSNSIFQNSRWADAVLFNGELSSLRNNYSVGSQMFAYFGFANSSGMDIENNIVISAAGQTPIGLYSPNLNFVTLIGNQFYTSGNTPAVFATSNPMSSYDVATGQPLIDATISSSLSALSAETYSDVTSIGNIYSATLPFTTTSWNQNFPFAPSSTAGILQCSTGTLPTLRDDRTACSYNQNNTNDYNLLTLDDQVGVTSAPPPMPTLPPFRPVVNRMTIIPQLSTAGDGSGAPGNAIAIQNAINTIVAAQANCAADDYYCPAKWGAVLLPNGNFKVGQTLNIPGSAPIRIIGTRSTSLTWAGGGSTSAPAPIFHVASPAHVVFENFSLYGDYGSAPVGEGIIAEVTDLSTSRILGEEVYLGSDRNTPTNLTIAGIGNATFEFRSAGATQKNTFMGNGSGTGYIAFFGGNPNNMTVGAGTNLLIQDMWYEGNNAGFIACPSGSSANITIQNAQLARSGYGNRNVHAAYDDHGQGTFDIGNCTGKTSVISTQLSRDSAFQQSADLALPSTSTASTEVMFLNISSTNSSVTIPYGVLPASYSGVIDQGYFTFDPASQAHYANLQSIFGQTYGYSNSASTNYGNYAAKQSGDRSPAFIRSMVAQARDPRLQSASKLIAPITDNQSTDIQLYGIEFEFTRNDIQFVLPGVAGQ